jgi:putative photosynthetic complex assembly protein 2
MTEMFGHGLTLLFAVVLWWFSTGIILMVCSMPSRTFGWTLSAGTVVFAASLYGLVASARETTAHSTYIAFLSAIGVWGWLEMGFLMGYVTGPRTAPCPADARGWHRFGLAATTLLYREFAVIVVGLLVAILTHGLPNQVGAFTFLILLVMRVSAELNIFLGVRYLPDTLLPERLSYLKSYFRTRRFNLLFPVSVLGATLAAIATARRALGADGAEAVGFALLSVLLALAILEHFFMMMPLPDAALWRWAKPLTMPKSAEKSVP